MATVTKDDAGMTANGKKWRDPRPELGTGPADVNPTRHPSWALDLNVIFPNFFGDDSEGSYLTYNMWPLAVDRTLWEVRNSFPRPQSVGQCFSQEYSKTFFRDVIKEHQRKRISSSMADIQTFYDAILPRMDAIISYLDQFPLNAGPTDMQRLLNLTFSLAEIAPAVEQFKQPSVADGYDTTRFVLTHNR